MHDISSYSEYKIWLVFADVLYLVLTSKKVDHIYSKSKLLIKTLFRTMGQKGEQQRKLWWESIKPCIRCIVKIL